MASVFVFKNWVGGGNTIWFHCFGSMPVILVLKMPLNFDRLGHFFLVWLRCRVSFCFVSFSHSKEKKWQALNLCLLDKNFLLRRD